MTDKKLSLEGLEANAKTDGNCCVSSISKNTDRRGTTYLELTLVDGKAKAKVKCFDSFTVATLLNAWEQSHTPFVVHMYVENRPYNGVSSYVATSVYATNTCKVDDFIFSYDVVCTRDMLMSFLKNNLTPEWLSVVDKLIDVQINETECIADRFFVEYAAHANHDACRGGLAAHTLKMLNICKAMVDNDKRLTPCAGLLYTGIFVHDIGKVEEYRDGEVQPNTCQSHRVLALDYLASCKNFIVEKVGIENYRRLQSIVLTHHHEFGAPCDTLWAFLVHLIDMLDAYAVMGLDTMESPTALTSHGNSKYLMCGDHKLYI